MNEKRVLRFTLIFSISLWALTTLVPDREALAASRKQVPVIEQAADSPRGAHGSSSRITAGGTNFNGDPDVTTQTGNSCPLPGSEVPLPGRSLLELLLRVVGGLFGSLQGFLSADL